MMDVINLIKQYKYEYRAEVAKKQSEGENSMAMPRETGGTGGGTASSLGMSLTRDPWKHRSKGMRCQTCMYFVLKETSKPPEQGTRIGRCRNHSPTMDGYPVVFEHDWCGDHKLDEEK
jgi:hypothetical protein